MASKQAEVAGVLRLGYLPCFARREGVADEKGGSDDFDWDEGSAEEIEDIPGQEDEPLWTPPQISLKSILGLIGLLAIICSMSATLGTGFENRAGGIIALILVGVFLFVVGMLISGLIRLVQSGESEDLQAGVDDCRESTAGTATRNPRRDEE